MARRVVSAEELIYYQTHFREAVREDGVVCLECGRLLRSLTPHVRPHGLTLDDYQEKWGYNRNNPLMVPALVDWWRQWAITHRLADTAPRGIID